MALSLGGNKQKSKSSTSQNFNQTASTSLTPRAYDALTGRVDQLGQREYKALDPNAYKAYEDPYQQEVIDATTADINANRDVAANEQRKQMLARGALGSSDRRGIGEAELQGQYDRTLATTLGALRSRGFAQSTGIAQGENTNANNYDANTQAMINQLMALLGNETTTTTSGSSTGTTRGSGYGMNFGFEK